MKKIFLFIILNILYVCSFGQTKENIFIIPEPVTVKKQQGEFTLPKNISIKAPADASLKHTVSFLRQRLSSATGYTTALALQNSSDAPIQLELSKTVDTKLGDEGYLLSVTPKNIIIKANKPAGIFYGVQSFLQLLPAEIENASLVKDVRWKLPAVEIIDYPRVGWRGLMLDAARHFFTVKAVKQYIDAMARYKYNLLHMHLTDDEGWRIEIKSFPKLTEVGAWRVGKVGRFGGFSNPLPDEPKDYGGFYTQDDIKELVQYAKDRFINIMPEIDVPGHSMAAVASYPELSCTEGTDKYTVRAGEPNMDWSQGKPNALKDNTLCPANEKVYDFMDKVITELSQLFPFNYIHAGGDEATHNFWEKSEQVKALMQKEGLIDMKQVQGYFQNRVEKIINSKGKKMMAWDEIVDCGVSNTATAMNWRSQTRGVEAIKKGYNIVMSPNSHTYIDFMQGDVATEAPVYLTLRLKKAYEFEPIPKQADAKYILGGQANLWTEQVYNIRQAEYMTWPRGFAIAESLWSPVENKNWKTFAVKVEEHFKRLDNAEIKYSPAIFDPIVNVTKQNDKYYVELVTEIDGLDIYATFDNSTPDNFYPKYTVPLEIPKDAWMMRIITYRGKQPIGRVMSISVADLKKRVKQ